VELRQLTYFVAVAEELHFGRAAERLHLAGPSLSQQISNLERELGTQLLVRDRRHVELTPAGSQFLTDAREVLGAAARAFDRARKGGGELPLRLGYVSWLPAEAAAMPDQPVQVDAATTRCSCCRNDPAEITVYGPVGAPPGRVARFNKIPPS
jgi:DNA-binding transcriptional LysR family regulator